MPDSRHPGLPEEFGNPWMSNLQEIELPESVPFTPEAVGWYALAGLLLLGLLWIACRLWRRWREGAYRREAQRELSELANLTRGTSTRSRALQGLPVLLKRVALVAYPRTEVARLSGDAWLGFLDEASGSTDFTRGVGRLLPVLAYDVASASRITEAEASGLFSLAGRWIRGHHSPRKSGAARSRSGGSLRSGGRESTREGVSSSPATFRSGRRR